MSREGGGGGCQGRGGGGGSCQGRGGERRISYVLTKWTGGKGPESTGIEN